MLLSEIQKGVNIVQRSSVENQKGTISIDFAKQFNAPF